MGAALECIHCYSLVHDDLPAIDDDKATLVALIEADARAAPDALKHDPFRIMLKQKDRVRF